MKRDLRVIVKGRFSGAYWCHPPVERAGDRIGTWLSANRYKAIKLTRAQVVETGSFTPWSFEMIPLDLTEMG